MMQNEIATLYVGTVDGSFRMTLHPIFGYLLLVRALPATDLYLEIGQFFQPFLRLIRMHILCV